jgi:hypothetical protein
MKARCYSPGSISFKNYGARGITVCERWLGEDGFSHFFADMGIAPENKQIERNNNSGNYEPGNCSWATAKEQANNRRSNRLITSNGITKTLKQWAEETHLSRNTIERRIDVYGWAVKDALTTPVKTPRNEGLPA